MAELTHFYNEENAVGTFTSSVLTNTAVSGSNPAQILGSALTAKTKYLIVARAVYGVNSATNKGTLRVQTDDDPTIADKSASIVEFEQTGSDEYISYLFVHSFTTDASPADVELQGATAGSTCSVDQTSLFLLDLDFNLIATYYFDASDAGPTDASGDWNTDADAFDGNRATSAQKSGSGGGVLSGEGTTAPTTGSAIGDVAVLVSLNGFGSVSNPLNITVEEDSVGGTTLGSFTVSNSSALTVEILLTAPAGGWTWQKVNDLAISFDSTDSNGQVFAADVKVYDSNGRGYLEDIQATTTDEYSTTAATTVLASIAGSDLGTTEHLILGSAGAEIGSTGRWFNHSLHLAYDASSASEASVHQAEGEDTAEQRIVGFAARHKASSGTPSVTLYGSEEAANGNMLDGGAYLIALPTTLFADFVDDYTATATSGLDGTETTIATSGSYTPTTTGNHLIFGRTAGVGTPTALGGMWVESTTTEIRTGDATPTHNQLWDTGKDNEYMATFQRYSITTAETFNLRAQGAGADFEVEDRWLIVVNLNEAGGGGAGSASPAAIVRAFTVDNATLVGPAVEVQPLIARSFTVDDALTKSPITVTPDVINRSFLVNQPAGLVGPAVEVAPGIDQSFAVDQVTPVAPVTDVQAVTALSFTVDDVTTVGLGKVLPAVTARSFLLGAPTLVGSAVDVQAVINRLFALDQVTPVAPATDIQEVIARLFTVDAPTVKGAAVDVQAVIARSFGVNAVTLVGASVDVQAVINRVFALDQVTPTNSDAGAGSASPAATILAFTVDDIAALVGGGVVIPGVTARSFTVDNVTVVGKGVDVQAVINRSFVLGGPTLVGGGVDVQAVINRAFALGSPTLVGQAVDVQTLINRSFTVDAVTVAGAAVDVQAVIARSFALGAPVLVGKGVDVQAVIARSFLLDQVTLLNSDGGSASPAVIARLFTVDAVTVVGQGVVVPAVINLAFDLPIALGLGGNPLVLHYQISFVNVW